MISFYLNDKFITINLSPASILLDFLRYNQKLTGTKVSCREGDCGACTVLVGSINTLTNELEYKPITSCLTPLALIANKHVVTIEGINPVDRENLTPVQEAFVENGSTQCGFCTPGFVMSITGYFLNKTNKDTLLNHLDGNICRCTGYKSIERACAELTKKYEVTNDEISKIQFLVSNNFVPEYFLSIEQKLRDLNVSNPSRNLMEKSSNCMYFGGGTDLMVQNPDKILESEVVYLLDQRSITENENYIIIPGSTTFEEFFDSDIANAYISNLKSFKSLIGSTQIRNMGTIGGNIANASPIGDATIILLALNASIVIQKSESTSEILLKDFFKGYKELEKDKGDLILEFMIPKVKAQGRTFFNFEKVSKRKKLDIASVNSAISLELDDNDLIRSIYISAGGIAPIPKFLDKTSAFLLTKSINSETVISAIEIAKSEVDPISDVRGSREYKLLLLGQLILTHFLTLFPNHISFQEVFM